MADDDQLVCCWDDCGKIFSVDRDLKDHIIADHIGGAKTGNLLAKLTCHWTGCPAAESQKVYAKREALKSHINTHVDDYPFACAKCGAKFKRRPDLNKHTVKVRACSDGGAGSDSSAYGGSVRVPSSQTGLIGSIPIPHMGASAGLSPVTTFGGGSGGTPSTSPLSVSPASVRASPLQQPLHMGAFGGQPHPMQQQQHYHHHMQQQQPNPLGHHTSSSSLLFVPGSTESVAAHTVAGSLEAIGGGFVASFAAHQQHTQHVFSSSSASLLNQHQHHQQEQAIFQQQQHHLSQGGSGFFLPSSDHVGSQTDLAVQTGQGAGGTHMPTAEQLNMGAYINALIDHSIHSGSLPIASAGEVGGQTQTIGEQNDEHVDLFSILANKPANDVTLLSHSGGNGSLPLPVVDIDPDSLLSLLENPDQLLTLYSDEELNNMGSNLDAAIYLQIQTSDLPEAAGQTERAQHPNESIVPHGPPDSTARHITKGMGAAAGVVPSALGPDADLEAQIALAREDPLAYLQSTTLPNFGTAAMALAGGGKHRAVNRARGRSSPWHAAQEQRQRQLDQTHAERQRVAEQEIMKEMTQAINSRNPTTGDIAINGTVVAESLEHSRSTSLPSALSTVTGVANSGPEQTRHASYPLVPLSGTALGGVPSGSGPSPASLISPGIISPATVSPSTPHSASVAGGSALLYHSQQQLEPRSASLPTIPRVTQPLHNSAQPPGVVPPPEARHTSLPLIPVSRPGATGAVDGSNLMTSAMSIREQSASDSVLNTTSTGSLPMIFSLESVTTAASYESGGSRAVSGADQTSTRIPELSRELVLEALDNICDPATDSAKRSQNQAHRTRAESAPVKPAGYPEPISASTTAAPTATQVPNPPTHTWPPAPTATTATVATALPPQLVAQQPHHHHGNQPRAHSDMQAHHAQILQQQQAQIQKQAQQIHEQQTQILQQAEIQAILQEQNRAQIRTQASPFAMPRVPINTTHPQAQTAPAPLVAHAETGAGRDSMVSYEEYLGRLPADHLVSQGPLPEVPVLSHMGTPVRVRALDGAEDSMDAEQQRMLEQNTVTTIIATSVDDQPIVPNVNMAALEYRTGSVDNFAVGTPIEDLTTSMGNMHIMHSAGYVMQSGMSPVFAVENPAMSGAHMAEIALSHSTEDLPVIQTVEEMSGSLPYSTPGHRRQMSAELAVLLRLRAAVALAAQRKRSDGHYAQQAEHQNVAGLTVMT